jgi:4-hydroxybenzoate polyprenyltransferase
MLLLLIVPWLYLAAMSKEFFARDWLKARPITYLWTHMLIMPLVDLYATGCDWFAARASIPPGLGWFLAASFFNGLVVEFGRKIRAPADEEIGVQTYSALWGRARAVSAWLCALVLTAVCTGIVALRIDFLLPVLGVLTVLFLAGAAAGWRLVHHPQSGSGKVLELLSGVWTLGLYLSLGAVPLLLLNWTRL